jgi:hypothetical protein
MAVVWQLHGKLHGNIQMHSVVKRLSGGILDGTTCGEKSTDIEGI